MGSEGKHGLFEKGWQSVTSVLMEWSRRSEKTPSHSQSSRESRADKRSSLPFQPRWRATYPQASPPLQHATRAPFIAAVRLCSCWESVWELSCVDCVWALGHSGRESPSPPCTVRVLLINPCWTGTAKSPFSFFSPSNLKCSSSKAECRGIKPEGSVWCD